jgi:hypothetical protein
MGETLRMMTNLHPKVEGSVAPMPYNHPEDRGRSEEGNVTWQTSA